MADPQSAAFTTFGVIEETTYGTTPSAAKQLINITSVPSLALSKGAQGPSVITGDLRDYPTSSLQQGGAANLSSPLQYNNFLLMHEGILLSDQGAAVSVTGTGISAASNVVSDSGNGFGSIQKGDLVMIYGAGVTPNTTGANSTLYGPVLAAAAGSFTLPAGQIQNFSAGGSVTVKTRRLVDGTTSKSYSPETQATQLTDKFRNGTGFCVQNWGCSWAQGSFVTETAQLSGKRTQGAAATIGTGAATAAPTSPFLNAVGDFQSIYIDGTAATHVITQWNLALQRAMQMHYGVGNLGPGSVTFGKLSATLSATVLWTDDSDVFLDHDDAHTTLGVHFWVKDSLGNAMAFQMPATKVSGAQTQGNDPNAALEVSGLTFTAHDASKDPSSPYYSLAFGREFAMYYFAA